MQPVPVWHRFLFDRSGAFLPIFALVTAVLLVSVGMGLDYARALNDRGEGQAVADAMVLAMAQELRLGNSQDAARDVARRIYDSHYGVGSGTASLEIRTLNNSSGYDLNVAFPGRTETTLMKLARFDQIPWQVNAASRVGMENLELALVVDVSNSMLSKNKMQEMRDALKRLVHAVFPDGVSASNRVISIIPYADHVRLGAAFKSWMSQKSYFPGEECMRSETLLHIVQNTPRNVGSFNRVVPSSIWSDGGYYRFCPPEKSNVLMFSQERGKLVYAIDGLQNGWGTGTDIGLSWGWRALSPQWRGAFTKVIVTNGYPRDFSNGRLKILVVLTDGHTIRYDPLGNGAGSFGIVEGIPGVVEDFVETTKESELFALATAHLIQTCSAIAKEGKIKLYTIGYDLDSPADAPRQNAMKALTECPANGGKHYHADYGDLVNVIDQLIAEFNIVRLYE